MKKYVGKKVQFIIDGMSDSFSARVVSDHRDRVVVQDDMEQAYVIIKQKIVMFKPLEKVDEEDEVSLNVLYCENPTTGCPGVQYVKEGGYNRKDFQTFMGPCQHHCGTCRAGSRGDVRSMDGRLLRRMLSGTMFGEYPHEKSEE